MGVFFVFIKKNFKVNWLWSNLMYLSIRLGHSQTQIGPSHLKIVDFINMFLGCHNPFHDFVRMWPNGHQTFCAHS